MRMLLYARDGEETPLEDVDYPGNERFVWPAAKQQIDLTYAENAKQRENGKKGGRPKTQQNPDKPTETQDNPTKAYKVKESNVKESNVKESLLGDDDAHAIQREQDQVLTAAENAGFNTSPMSRAKIVELYAEHGKDKILNAISECVRYGVTNLAYLEAVLKGGPKKSKPRVSAQDFEQRDYTDVQKQIEEETAQHVIQMLKDRGEWDYEHNCGKDTWDYEHNCSKSEYKGEKA